MNSLIVRSPALTRYFIADGVLEWCDGWWVAFRFGDVNVVALNEYEYFTSLWAWSLKDVLQVIENLTGDGLMDALNLFAARVEEVPSLTDQLVIEGEVL